MFLLLLWLPAGNGEHVKASASSVAAERGEPFQPFFTLTSKVNGLGNPHVLCALEAAERVALAKGTKVRE